MTSVIPIMRTRQESRDAAQIIRATLHLPRPLASIVAEYAEDWNYVQYIKLLARARDAAPKWTLWVAKVDISELLFNVLIGKVAGYVLTLHLGRDRTSEVDSDDDMWDFLTTGVPSPGIIAMIGESTESVVYTAVAEMRKALHVKLCIGKINRPDHIIGP